MAWPDSIASRHPCVSRTARAPTSAHRRAATPGLTEQRTAAMYSIGATAEHVQHRAIRLDERNPSFQTVPSGRAVDSVLVTLIPSIRVPGSAAPATRRDELVRARRPLVDSRSSSVVCRRSTWFTINPWPAGFPMGRTHPDRPDRSSAEADFELSVDDLQAIDAPDTATAGPESLRRVPPLVRLIDSRGLKAMDSYSRTWCTQRPGAPQ